MRLLVLVVLMLPLASAAPMLILEDPAGDVEVSSWGTGTDAPGDWSAVDILGLYFEETPGDLYVTVDMGGFPTCEANTCSNAGDHRVYFQRGALGYFVQLGLNPLGNAYGVLHSVEPGQVDGPVIDGALGATKDLDATTVTVRVPRELLVDENGAPPTRGETMTHIHQRAYSQFSLGMPDPRGNEDDDFLVTRDRAGFDAMANFTFEFGGAENSGPITIASPAPYRSSNGGAATYLYTLQVQYDGDQAAAFDIDAKGIPVGWTFLRPNGTLTLEPGAMREFGILIETPSGHQHGGATTFDLQVTQQGDPNVWARLELGVHYLSTPQPAGHHPTLWFHTLTDGTLAQVVATFGSDDGRIWMNTLEDDPGDEDVGVVAQEGFVGFEAQRSTWSICMIPNLRMGLDFDTTRTGTLDVQLGSAGVHQGVRLTGELLHIAGPEPLDFCAPQLYRDREHTVLATMEDDGLRDLIAGQTSIEATVVPTPESDLVPYEEGAQLVMEITATFTGGDPSHDGLRLYEGRLDLPLLEYHDGRPAGFVGGVVTDPVDQVLEDLEESVAEEKESPAGFLPVLVAIALARRLR